MADRRMYPPGAQLCPTGLVVMDAAGRRGHIIGRPAPGTCTWCGVAVPAGRRTWCSKACVDAYNVTQPNRYKAKVRRRDKGKGCAGCCSTPIQFRRYRQFGSDELVIVVSPVRLEVDHIVPIIEGGHPFELANLRSLCRPCHQQETRVLAGRRAARRRAA